MTREEFQNELENRVSDVNIAFEQVASAATCLCSNGELDEVIDETEVKIENIENSLEYLKDTLQNLKHLKDMDIEENEE